MFHLRANSCAKLHSLGLLAWRDLRLEAVKTCKDFRPAQSIILCLSTPVSLYRGTFDGNRFGKIQTVVLNQDQKQSFNLLNM
jgi:hypothetical protein